MTQEENIVHRVRLLEELVESQTQVLDTANSIIEMKTRLVELCEREIEIHRRENSRLQRVVFGLCIVLLLNVIVHLVQLLH